MRRRAAEPTPLQYVFRYGPKRPGLRQVLLEVAKLGDRDGPTWGQTYARVSTIATRAGVCERTAQRTLSALVQAGHLTRTDRPGRTCIWAVVRAEKPVVEPVVQEVVAEAQTGLFAPEKGVTNWRGRGDILSPDLSNNPTGVTPPASATRLLPPQRRASPSAAPPDLDPLARELAKKGLWQTSAVLRPDDVPRVRAAMARVGPARMAKAALDAADRAARRRDGPALTWQAWVECWAGLQPAPDRRARPSPDVADVGTRTEGARERALSASGFTRGPTGWVRSAS